MAKTARAAYTGRRASAASEAAMLNYAIWILWALSALTFAALVVLVVMWLTGTLPDVFYMEVRTLSGNYRSVTFPDVLGFLFVVGVLAAAAAALLTRYYPSPR